MVGIVLKTKSGNRCRRESGGLVAPDTQHLITAYTESGF